jgi:cytochrome c-type biogenesis protein CcmE
MKLSKASIFGITIIAVSLGLIIYQATKSESSVTFYTPEEVYANPKQFENKLFRVSGLVVRGSKIWDAKSSFLKFLITDLKGHDFHVNYKGIPPDLFKEGQGVIVEGYLQSISSKQIEADLLLVKHSEVYDTKVDHSQLRQAKLIESILKDQKVKTKEREK